MSSNIHDKDRNVTTLDEEQSVVQPKEASSSNENALTTLAGRKKFIAVAVGLLVLIVVAYFIRNAFLYEDTDDAQVDGHVMPLSARIQGHILEVRVIEGQLVHAGDVLVVLDSKDYQVAVNQARANLADAEASSASSHFTVL